jgi:hypothetical protein
MRSLWCTLIAVCFVAVGVRPRHAERTHGDASAIHIAAKHVSSARRAASSTVGPVVAPEVLGVGPPRQRVHDVASIAPSSPQPRPACSPRSSRGPPHA